MKLVRLKIVLVNVTKKISKEMYHVLFTMKFVSKNMTESLNDLVYKIIKNKNNYVRYFLRVIGVINF